MLRRQTVSFNQTKGLTNDISLEIERKKVGILGGTFNPPHVGHLIIADQVCRKLDLDKLYFMPSANPPHRNGKKAIPASYRLEMVETAIENNGCFDVERAEIERGGKSFTYDTMVQLVRENPDIDYYFIIGGDMVDYLPKWYKIDKLLDLVQFVGVNRPGYVATTGYPIIWVDVPSMNISSTLLREKLKMNDSVRYLIPDQTLKYIHEKGLYQNGDKINGRTL
ncbi:nicotinate-nucleotide adenylyltransferase [Carnobacterium sp. TMP28]|uniref:nicotinate-nucleotide adenylyltransferase n=1 Tax=Carnobacterium sp. TMP28 TaxID=3397060 RepID=UPI0039DF7398